MDCGCHDCLVKRDKEQAAEIARLRQALEDIVTPMNKLRRVAEAEGAKLNGHAYAIANDPGYVRSIATDALKPQT